MQFLNTFSPPFINVEIYANKSSLRRANAHFYCVSCGFLPAIHTLELAFLGIPLLSFFFPCALVSFHFARIGHVLVPCRSACATITDTIWGHEKASLRVPKEAVRIALIETQREVKRLRVSSAKCRLSWNFRTFPSTTALQHSKLLSADFSPPYLSRRSIEDA